MHCSCVAKISDSVSLKVEVLVSSVLDFFIPNKLPVKCSFKRCVSLNFNYIWDDVLVIQMLVNFITENSR